MSKPTAGNNIKMVSGLDISYLSIWVQIFYRWDNTTTPWTIEAHITVLMAECLGTPWKYFSFHRLF